MHTILLWIPTTIISNAWSAGEIANRADWAQEISCFPWIKSARDRIITKPATNTKKDSAAETVQMLINAQEVERQRLSRQMHDGPAQALSNFILANRNRHALV